jgi:hypothetical protein
MPRNTKGQFERVDPVEHFLANYRENKVTGCWDWIGAMFTNGYGSFKCKEFSRIQIPASRASWILSKGEIDETIFVLHRCDNRRCVNPEHLFLGDGKANMEDCKAKGRMNKGEDRPQAKLTEENVAELRKLRSEGWPWRRLAKRYGVSPSCILSAVTRQTWDHVP